MENDRPIVVQDLHKAFGSQKVLEGVNLEVRKGETIVVLGRSGSGKSVLLKLLIGLQKPDKGTIQIAGEELAKLDVNKLNEIRRKMGFLFQQAALYDSLSVKQNVEFPLERNGKISEQEREKRA